MFGYSEVKYKLSDLTRTWCWQRRVPLV